MYLREILRESLFGQTEETSVYEDNCACILTSENPVSREKSRHVVPIQQLVAESHLPRHVNVRWLFLRELMEIKVMRLLPWSTRKMVADQQMPSPRACRSQLIACIALRCWGFQM